MVDENTDEYTTILSSGIHHNITDRLSNLDSEKRGKITEEILSGAIDSYVAANAGSNNLAGSADKQRAHLKEEHPELSLNTPPVPALDLYLTGGQRPLALESELDGPKAVIADFKKLTDRTVGEDKVIVTETKSKKGLGNFSSNVKAASKTDGGRYTHVEIYRRKNQLASTAQVRTTTYSNGEITYDSKDEESKENMEETTLSGVEMKVAV